MTREDIKSLKLAVALSIILVFTFLSALTIGRYPISYTTLYNILIGNATSYTIEISIITNLRLPRTIVAVLVGVALSVSGLVYQEVFRNKLVSPDFLGVSSGASVGAAIAIILGLSTWYISMFAFTLGIFAMLLTLFFA